MQRLADIHRESGADTESIAGKEIPRSFGDLHGEYAAARSLAIHDRNHRGLIEVTGGDAQTWLHGQMTAHVKNLQSGEGCYAFALDTKGRILFDLNVLVMDDSVWLDVDRRWISRALERLDKYIIVDDVQLHDRSDVFGRVALLGSELAVWAKRVGIGHLSAMPQLAHLETTLHEISVRAVRHDFAGVLSAELIVPVEQEAALWHAIQQGHSDLTFYPVGSDAVRILRVEAGVPASCEDIDERVLPAETGQTDRAVSFQKGCYLGQEIVERMRAHKSVARSLVGLTIEGDGAEPGAGVFDADQQVGRITSAVYSPRLNQHIALGYIKTTHAQPATRLTVRTDHTSTPCTVSSATQRITT